MSERTPDTSEDEGLSTDVRLHLTDPHQAGAVSAGHTEARSASLDKLLAVRVISGDSPVTGSEVSLQVSHSLEQLETVLT